MNDVNKEKAKKDSRIPSSRRIPPGDL